MICMRVDLKSFINVTIHLQRSPSWLDKPSILPQGQIETILWGLEHLMENSIFTVSQGQLKIPFAQLFTDNSNLFDVC